MAELDRDRVPYRTQRRAGDPAVDEPAEYEGRVAGGTAAGVVPHIGNHRRLRA